MTYHSTLESIVDVLRFCSLPMIVFLVLVISFTAFRLQFFAIFTVNNVYPQGLFLSVDLKTGSLAPEQFMKHGKMRDVFSFLRIAKNGDEFTVETSYYIYLPINFDTQFKPMTSLKYFKAYKPYSWSPYKIEHVEGGENIYTLEYNRWDEMITRTVKDSSNGDDEVVMVNFVRVNEDKQNMIRNMTQFYSRYEGIEEDGNTLETLRKLDVSRPDYKIFESKYD